MPLFLHVHDAPGISYEDVFEAHVQDIFLGNRRGIDYQRFWVDSDAGKFFCLVEAPTPEDAEAVHVDAHGMLSADVYCVREGLRDRRDHEAMRVLFMAALAPNSNCVDIGCNRGVILREMLRCAPEGKHIAFEPIPELSATLVTRFPQVDVRQAALSNEPGESEFVHLPERPGYSHLLGDAETSVEPSAKLITVEVEALDGVLPDDYVPTLLKIDVERAELAVIKGAAVTLATFQPITVFEHGWSGGADSEEIFELVSREAGLRIYDIDGNGPMERQWFLDTVAAGRVWNFVARP